MTDLTDRTTTSIMLRVCGGGGVSPSVHLPPSAHQSLYLHVSGGVPQGLDAVARVPPLDGAGVAHTHLVVEAVVPTGDNLWSSPGSRHEVTLSPRGYNTQVQLAEHH